MLYIFDATFSLTGSRTPQRRPNGDPILNVIDATPTQPGSHKLGHAQVWRGNHDAAWPYSQAQCDLAAQGADGAWWYIADHRQCLDNQGRVIEGTGTPYWLPAPLGDDTHDSQPRTMKELGPLPEGAVLTQPEKPLATAQDEKRREINRAHGEVLSYLLAESPNPTAVEAALAVEDMRDDDPEGLRYVRGLADARRDELLGAVDAAGSVGEVEAIVVSYPV